MVRARVESTNQVRLLDDSTVKLQTKDRPHAYMLLHQRVIDYLQHNNAAHVLIQASAVPKAGASMGLLQSAEVRGVVQAACRSAVQDVRTRGKGSTSRTYGSRNVSEYAKDDDFWSRAILDPHVLRKGSREIALLLLAEIEAEQSG